MTREERLMEIMGKISDEYIDEAHATIDYDTVTKRKDKSFFWKSLVATAACICLLAVCLPTISNTFVSKPKETGSSIEENVTTVNYTDELNDILYVNYNNYKYQIFETSISPTVLNIIDYDSSKDFLFSKGVPHTITKEMVGNHLCYLTMDDENIFIVSNKETDIELLEYAPSPSDAVYIVKSSSSYLYAFISKLSNYSDNAGNLSNLYYLYGISDSCKLSSISVTNKKNTKTIGETATNLENINKYYALSQNLEFYSMNDFHEEASQNLTQEELFTFVNDLDTEYINLCIETTSGIKLTLKYYPECGWLYSHISDGYYKITDELKEWFDQHLVD